MRRNQDKNRDNHDDHADDSLLILHEISPLFDFEICKIMRFYNVTTGTAAIFQSPCVTQYRFSNANSETSAAKKMYPFTISLMRKYVHTQRNSQAICFFRLLSLILYISNMYRIISHPSLCLSYSIFFLLKQRKHT
jgi:hypothetical protein